MTYITTKNTSLIIDPELASIDQGWTISGDTARHASCFPGIITAESIEIEAGKSWIVEYEVSEYTSGGVYPIVAGINGTNRTALGSYKEQFDVPANSTDTSFKFYSDGELGINFTAIYPVLEDTTNGITLGFNADENKWTTYYSFIPEWMLKFTTSFFAFKNGRLWRQNVNETRNNFFGVQYTSRITFYVNINATEVKNFISLREKSNKVWSVIEALILPYYGKPNGQKSRIKKGRFKNLQGDWFADFLKDMNDPRFFSQTEALFKGADLQGNVLKITLENDEISEVRLLSIDFNCNSQNYTY